MLKINMLRTIFARSWGAGSVFASLSKAFLGEFTLLCRFTWGFLLAGLCLLSACGEPSKEVPLEGTAVGSALRSAENPVKRSFGKSALPLPALKHARLLKIDSLAGQEVVEIRAVLGKDTLAKRYVLRSESQKNDPIPEAVGKADVIVVPVKRVVALSTSYLGYMEALEVTDRVVGVGGADYIADSSLYVKSHGESPAIVEVGNGAGVSLEKVIGLKPDLVMTFATGGAQDDYERLKKLGVPVMLLSEWQEESALAKAEWIKLFGKLFAAEDSSGVDRALRHFNAERKSYEHFRMRREDCDGFRVMAGMAYGGVWYAPGGNSFTARLIKDAGGCYLWAADTSRELKLTLEEVLSLGDKADIWVNPGAYGKVEDLLSAEPRAAELKPLKNRRIYQMDKKLGPGGGNDFYEGAVAAPSEVLLDLIQVFKTGLISDRRTIWYHNIF